jgi:hypothetical protein
MKQVDDILKRFEPVSLGEMDRVGLMNRTDTKFAFSSSHLSEILQSIQSDYHILVVDHARVHKYDSLYFDTTDFRMYTDHHAGKASRYKIRARKYVDTNHCFLEIKFKNNKGRTIKSRMPLPEIEQALQGSGTTFLSKNSAFRASELEPKLYSSFFRITLISKHAEERITIDTGLQFKNGVSEVNLPQLAILEVKRADFRPSAIMQVMKHIKIREGAISKYCFGVTQLYNHVKKNNFKPEILAINKINDETTA